MNAEKLAESGIDYYEGVSRFAGKDKLYEEYLKRFTLDTAFEKLLSAVEACDANDAFKYAHDLYGTLGNLSMNLLVKEFKPIVETLRLRNLNGILEKLHDFSHLYRRVTDAINEAQQEN